MGSGISGWVAEKDEAAVSREGGVASIFSHRLLWEGRIFWGWCRIEIPVRRLFAKVPLPSDRRYGDTKGQIAKEARGRVHRTHRLSSWEQKQGVSSRGGRWQLLHSLSHGKVWRGGQGWVLPIRPTVRIW